MALQAMPPSTVGCLLGAAGVAEAPHKAQHAQLQPKTCWARPVHCSLQAAAAQHSTLSACKRAFSLEAAYR